MAAPTANRDQFGGVAVEEKDEFGGVALAAAPERDQFGGVPVVEPTSNKAADFARRIPEGMATGTARTIQGAARFADIARDTPAVPFFGGVGMERAAQTQAAVNQQIATENRQRAATRQQRMEESTAYQFGAKIYGDARDTYGVDRARDNEFLAQLATAGSEMVPTLIFGGLAGPLGAGAQYAASAGESQAQEAIAAGRPETADVAFLSAAGLGGLTEAALGVPGRLFAIANRARKAGVNPGRFGQWANRNPVKSGILKAGAESGAREAGQEGLEQAGGNLIASDVAGYDPNRPTGQGVGRAMALGGVLGGVMGGGAAGANQVSRNQQAAALRQGRAMRLTPDGPAYVVNSETGGTEFGPVDELPAPLALEMIEDSGEKIEDRAAQAAPSTLYPLPSILSLEPLEGQPYDLSPPETLPPEATPPSTAAPAPAGLPTTKSEPISSQLVVEPIQFSPYPEPLEGQPYNTRLENRPEAAMETRPSARWTPDAPREPAVDPDLAETIAALRAGYRPEVEKLPEAAKPVEQMTPEESEALRTTLLKGVENRGDGIFFVPEKLMTPARRKAVQRGGDAVQVKPWSDVTGVPSDRGYAILDRRERIAARTKPAPASTGATAQKLPESMAAADFAPPAEGQPDMVVIGCGKNKVSTNVPVPAADLYTGQLFKGRRQAAEASGRPWMVVSAAHGLVPPGKLLSPYNLTIGDLKPEERAEWQRAVRADVLRYFGGNRFDTVGKSIEVHAGADYVKALNKALEGFGITITTPMEGKGIGQQLAQYKSAKASIVQQLDAAIESAKIKPGGLYSLPDLGLTVTLWNGTLNAVQLSLRAGQRLAEAIQTGIDWLRAQGQQFDEAKVRAALEEAIRQSPSVSERIKSQTIAGRTVGTSQPTTKTRTGEGTDPSHNVELSRLREANPAAYRKNAMMLTRYPVVARDQPRIAGLVHQIDAPLIAAERALEKAQAELAELKKQAIAVVASTRQWKKSEVKGKHIAGFLARNRRSALAGNFKVLQKKIRLLSKLAEVESDKSDIAIAELLKNRDLITTENADAIYESYIKAVESNLETLAELFPKRLRDLATLWYDGANLIAQGFGKQYRTTLEQASAVLAVFSPQKDWFMNVSLAERMMAIWQNQQDAVWSEEMTKQFIKRSGEPQPRMEKAADGTKVEMTDEEGNTLYKGGAVPVEQEDGTIVWENWDNAKAAEGLAEAKELLLKLEGKRLRELADPELQARFVRMFSEVNHPISYQKVAPNGEFVGDMTNDKGVAMKIAWGGYGTIEKAIQILQASPAGEHAAISEALGAQHKVRSFYNNIVDPQNKSGHVTMDTHAVAALLWIPLSGASLEVTQNFGGAGVQNSGAAGIKGTYAANAEAYRRAAQALGLLPRELQSITWEAVRMLFPAKWKGSRTNVANVRAVWQKYLNHELTIEQARAAIFQLATASKANPGGRDISRAIEDGSGVGEPSWAASMGDRASDLGNLQEADDTGVLSSGGGAGRLGLGQRAGDAGGISGRRGSAAVVRPDTEGRVDGRLAGQAAKLDAAIESAKIKPGGLYSLPDLGLTVTLWNGTLNAVQLSLRAGQRLAEAIQTGIDWLRAQGQQFDEAKVRAALEQAILQSPGVREHVGKRLLQEDFSPAAKAAVEKLLLHEVKPDEQLFAEAAAVIEAVGPREALASYFGNPWGLPQDSHVVLGFALGNALSTMETQARAAGDAATANRIGQENAEFQSQFVLQSTETARTLRAYRYFDLVGNLSPFTADVFARKVIEKANAQERNRIKPTLDTVGTELDRVNQQAVNEAAGDKGVQGTARTVINQTIEAEAERPDSAVRKAIVLEVSNTLETLPSVVRKASEAVVQAWRKLGLEEQVRVQTGRAGQALENSLWSAVKQRGGSASTVASVIGQVNRALHEQVNRTLGVTKEQFTNPATYLMRLRDALGNAEVMSRIWEQTRAAVGANLRAIGEMEGLLLRIEAEIAALEAQAKLPLAGGPEVTATDPKLKAMQQGARDAMLAGRNAGIAEAIKLRRERLADVAAQLEEFRKMKPAWEAVLGMTVDVWGPNLLRGVLREQMKADGFRLRKAVSDHFRGLAGAPDPLATLGTLTKKIIAASGLDEQAAGRLAKDFEAEYTALVEKERARLAERLAKTRERQAARAKQRAADQPRLDAEALIDGYERRQTEWLKPTGRKSAVRAIVRQALRQGAAVAGLDEQAVRGGLQAHLVAVGVPTEAAYRLAYEVWQARQAAGGGVDAVVAGRVKALQLNLGAIVRKHWSEVGRAGESLAAQIVGETGMPAEQAQRLADAIERRFKALATAKKEALLRNLAKTPAARQLQKKSVSQRIIEFSNLGAFDSEGLWNAVAEKLGLASYSAAASAEVKRLAEKAQQLPEGSVQRQEATARLMRFIARQHGLKLDDLGWAFWYANTLSGPITHLVNIGSNSLSLAGNVATQFRDVRGIPQILAATAKGFRTGGQEARAILKQGPGANRTKFTEQGQALENLDPQDFTGAGLVRQWRIVARALAAADAAFYFPAREAKAITLARALARQEGKTGAAIGQQARDLLDGTEQQQNLWGAQVDRERAQLEAMGEKPDALWTVRRLEQLREQAWGADIGEAADDFALRTTYNNQPYGLIGALADVAQFAQRKVPGVRLIVPFVNIVANVTNESINYTPWGFARAYAAGQTGVPSVNALWSEKLRNGQTPLTPDAVMDLHTKAALGTALVGGIMAAALAGLDDDDGENFQLYGQGPKDPAARKAWKETGAIPYSVRVNGKYISIANTPLAIPLGAMGNYLDAKRWDKRFEEANAFNRLGVALWGGAHVITQQSFLDSAARLAGAIENPRGRSDTLGDRGLAEALRSGGNLVVPNALRQLDRMFDPTLYDNRGIEGALVASIPFARRNGSPALNAFGEPITSSPWARFASDAKPNVWADLAHRGVYPSTAEKVKNRWGREMTDEEHYRYVELSGQAIKRRLDTPGMRAKIRTGEEQELRKALTGIVKDEREKARTKLGF